MSAAVDVMKIFFMLIELVTLISAFILHHYILISALWCISVDVGLNVTSDHKFVRYQWVRHTAFSWVRSVHTGLLELTIFIICLLYIKTDAYIWLFFSPCCCLFVHGSMCLPPVQVPSLLLAIEFPTALSSGSQCVKIPVDSCVFLIPIFHQSFMSHQWTGSSKS
jgi:hypothetical protein